MVSKIGPIPTSPVFSRYIKLLSPTASGQGPLSNSLTCQIVSKGDNLCHFGTAAKEVQSRNGVKLASCSKKRSIGFLRCSLGIPVTLLSRLLQDSKGLAGSGCGYRGRLSGRAFEVDHTIFAGAEVTH